MRRLTALFLGVTLLAAPSLVAAEELGGRYGAGAESSITGGPSVNGTYWVTDRIGAQATVTYLNANFDAAATPDVSVFLVGVGGVYNVFLKPRTHLGIVANAAFGVGDADAIRIHVGIRPELFVTNWLSFHTTVGVTYLSLGEKSGAPFSNVGNLSVFQGSALARAGITFYFGGAKGAAKPHTVWGSQQADTYEPTDTTTNGTTDEAAEDTTDDSAPDDAGEPEEGDDERN